MATTTRREASDPRPDARATTNAGSALLLEVAGGQTSAALIDLVEGNRHRFVAAGIRAHSHADADDLASRLHGCIEILEGRVSRRLRESNRLISPERKDGSGCDAAALTTSLPLKVALIASDDNPARRRLESVLATTVAIIGTRLDLIAVHRRGESALAALMSLLAERPEVVFVVAEPESSRRKATIDVGQHLSVALERADRELPIVLGVGTKAQTDVLGASVSRNADYRAIDLNAKGGAESLRSEALAAWRDTLDRRFAGHGLVRSKLSVPPLPTADGFAVALRYLASRRGAETWGVDLGEETTTIIRASQEQVLIGVAPMGSANAASWLGSRDAKGSAAEEVDGESLRDVLWNRLARPGTQPAAPAEHAATRMIAREAVAAVVSRAKVPSPNWKSGQSLLVIRGALAHSVAASANAIVEIARALGGIGLIEVAIDRHGILPGLGALAQSEPALVAEALLADGLHPLGTVAIGIGSGQRGIAADVELRPNTDSPSRCEAAVGAIGSMLLAAGETAELTITPPKGFDFGRGSGRAVAGRAAGGALGVIVAVQDASANNKRTSRG